jgi:hypothetical protein
VDLARHGGAGSTADLASGDAIGAVLHNHIPIIAQLFSVEVTVAAAAHDSCRELAGGTANSAAREPVGTELGDGIGVVAGLAGLTIAVAAASKLARICAPIRVVQIPIVTALAQSDDAIPAANRR